MDRIVSVITRASSLAREVRPKVDLRAGKVAEDDYNDGVDCKRRAVTSTAIEDMDWSSMTEDYVCFTEDFDADAELSELCDDGESNAAGGSSSSNDKDSDNEGHLLMILYLLPTGILVVIAVLILVMIKRRKIRACCRLSAAAPPTHEPTPLSPSTLASIKDSNLKMMGMMSEEPPQAAAPIAEAITLPHGHV